MIRRRAGEAAATAAAARAGRPAHHAHDDEAAAGILEHRAAGIARAGAEACGLPARDRIGELEMPLEGARTAISMSRCAAGRGGCRRRRSSRRSRRP